MEAAKSCERKSFKKVRTILEILSLVILGGKNEQYSI
jgi:hypothetical protein